MKSIKSSLGLKLIGVGIFCAILLYGKIIYHPLLLLGMVGFTFTGIIVYAIEKSKNSIK